MFRLQKSQRNLSVRFFFFFLLFLSYSHFRFFFLLHTVQQPNLSHPFHLHGYAFNVIGMGRSPDKNVKKINLKHALDLDRRGLLDRHFNLPPAKDTIAVPNNGYVVFRFRADNPGKYRNRLITILCAQLDQFELDNINIYFTR